MPKPTPTQVEVIKYFAGQETGKLNARSYAPCVRNGWIEGIEEFPYHRTTDAGRIAANITTDRMLEQ